MQYMTPQGLVTLGTDAPSKFRAMRSANLKKIDILRSEISNLDLDHAQKYFEKHQLAIGDVRKLDRTIADLVSQVQQTAAACCEAALVIQGKSRAKKWTAHLPANVTEAVLFLKEFRVAHSQEANEAIEALTEHAKQLNALALEMYNSAEKSVALVSGLEAKAQYALTKKQIAHRGAYVLKELTSPGGYLTQARKAEAVWKSYAGKPSDWKKDNAHQIYLKALDRLAGIELEFNQEQKALLDTCEAQYKKAMASFQQIAGRKEKEFNLGANNE